jgi:hypothetical protein
MLFGVLVVSESEVLRARRELRALLLAGQRRVHTAKESPARRRVLLDTVVALDVTVVVFSLRRAPGVSRAAARRRLLEAATGAVRDRGVTSWVLDRQDLAQAGRDRRAIVAALGTDHEITYRHQPSHEEPLLWAVDAVVWAFGAGGDWRRRVGDLVEPRQLRP